MYQRSRSFSGAQCAHLSGCAPVIASHQALAVERSEVSHG